MSDAPDHACMAGTFAVALRRNLRQEIGDAAFERTVAALSPEDRAELEATTSLGWARLDMVEAVVHAAADVTGREPEELHDTLTTQNVQRTLQGVWRLLVKAATDRMIIQRTPSLYTKAYNRGAVTSEWLAQGHATVTVNEWADISDYALRGGAIAVRALLEHAGRHNVEVSPRRTSEGAVLDVRWS